MTDRRLQNGRRTPGHQSSHASAVRRTDYVNPLASSAHGNANLLTIVTLDDRADLSEYPGAATPSDASSSQRAPASSPGEAARSEAFVDVLRCRVIWRLVAELFASACERDLPEGAARRRPRCHMRQIAMYLSHVVLSVPYRTIATAFGRDRTTVMHACSVVEDRRDDAGYDRFVEQCERCIKAVFSPLGHDNADL